MFCGWAGAFSLPASSNRLSISGGRLCGSCTPNVGGAHTAPISCNSIFNRHGVARIKHRGLAAVNSRKIAHGPSAGTLPVVYLYEDFLRGESILNIAFRGEFLTMGHRDLVCLHSYPQGLHCL